MITRALIFIAAIAIAAYISVAYADGTVDAQPVGQPSALCPLSHGWNLTVIDQHLSDCGAVWIYRP